MTRRSSGSRPHTKRSLRNGSASQGPGGPRQGIGGGERPRDADALAALPASSLMMGRADSQTLQHRNDNVENLLEADSKRPTAGRNSLGEVNLPNRPDRSQSARTRPLYSSGR